MGNVLDNKVSCDKPTAVVNPMPPVNEDAVVAENQEQQTQQEQEANRTNVTLQLFQYRQQLSLKNHQMVKWATSKLLLTEELLKQQQQQIQKLQEKQLRAERRRQRRQQPLLSMPILDESDAAWAERQLALLSDDEDDDDSDDDDDDDALQFGDGENGEPFEHPLYSEHTHLMRYRLQLRNTIIEVAQEKLRKREKTKIKRLKRRTLISSKKPSKKNKHKHLAQDTQ
ncbi:hypothetical protein KR222_006962 [Zaprionus bogoriensis]|nr:hypothetical protein KR222_006962 [Zaprionus bogoriensis]